jgi:hypothetical protein
MPPISTPQLPPTGGVLPSSSPWDITPDVSQQVFGVINPQLQSAADIINRRGQMGTGAISGLTGAYQSHLQGIGGMLGGWGQDKLKAAVGYGRDMLTGAGQTQAAGLGKAIQQIGPGISQGSDLDLAQQGKGAGGASYGTGIAELDALIAKQAASQARSAMEPSFAAMEGQQQQGMLAAQLARQLYEQQSQIMGQVPELALNLQNQAYQRQTDLRDYQERVREFNIQQGQTKAQIVGPNAPTISGRQQYWDKVAADRTAQTGTVYRGTTTGIRPITDPRTGQQVKTAEQKKELANYVLATGLDPNTGAPTPETVAKLKALGYGSGGGVSEGTVKTNVAAATAMAKENIRHNETIRKLQIAQQNADTAAGKAQIAAATATERHRHNVWVEQHPKAVAADKPIGTPTGNRPRVSKSGIWTYASGKRITDPRIINYWEKQYQTGRTDGRGGLGAVNKKSASGGGVPPHGTKRQPKKPGT